MTRLSKIEVLYNRFPILNTNNITLAINECKIVQFLHKRKSQGKLIGTLLESILYLRLRLQYIKSFRHSSIRDKHTTCSG